ncbi:MAG: EVE domain-containing protein [Methanocellales archaeon]|nr:EVE domain-containing protein [Methanocellales archaeon]
MKIILDTNILIHIEDPKELSRNLQDLLRILREHGHQPFIHPASLHDVNNDPDPRRKKVILSKLGGYPLLESPPQPTDEFLSIVGLPSNFNEKIDNEILFAIYKNTADFLITEDHGLHKKALQLYLDDRVLSVDSALEYFKSLHARKVPRHTLLKEDFVRNLDINDPFFDSLKEDYEGLSEWFKKISIEGRKCWVYHDEDDKIRALLILKEENEPILTSPPLSVAKRLKISTLKVDMPGFKIGELLLKIAFQYCIDNQIFETYLTHYRKEDDGLINLLEEFGFEMVGTLGNNEEVYLKQFIPEEKDLSPIGLAKKYYPSFKDSPSIKKFVVPIRPEYHDRLFPDYQKRQMKLTEYFEINIQGNTIKKAYLSHSKIRKIKSGDVLLFYRSSDQKRITSVGVVERILRTGEPDSILRFVGKRSVYSYEEIKKLAQKPVLVILFRHHLNLPNPLGLDYLREHNILNYAPQSIIEINHSQYEFIIKGGRLDERFTVS